MHSDVHFILAWGLTLFLLFAGVVLSEAGLFVSVVIMLGAYRYLKHEYQNPPTKRRDVDGKCRLANSLLVSPFALSAASSSSPTASILIGIDQVKV